MSSLRIVCGMVMVGMTCGLEARTSVAAAAAPFQPDGPIAIDGVTLLRSYVSPGLVNSSLYSVQASAATYTRPVLLIDLHGESRYQLGYAYGFLLGKEIEDAYTLFLTKLIGGSNVVRFDCSIPGS
jgi:hypothetical protein